MNQTKETFIRLALSSHALKFGNFTLKSGRESPYFFNAGAFYKASAIRTLGQCYAQTLIQKNIPCNHLFGPAYKGIPIAIATAVALAEQGVEASVTFNRKEQKTHGEGGTLIGAPLTGDTVILDDVISAGTAFREAKQLIEENGGKATAVLIALDRCEKGISNLSTREEIEKKGVQLHAIITLFDLIDYLKNQGEKTQVKYIESYLSKYGA